ncbi:Antibiotic biosynthesis monooxygenase [Rhodococcus sp. AW25M09]|uniref:antibiotic biosynthesis monooxygenase n=1 Tax=Rhodococcus sp. AW25M09 TaxID=1268303 RepID=UPI0002ABB225|nr:antibiotic biosynthesis monooxygenase [Rhodococcus sp. AW25M09]CCQ14458.1 Antibiotic biosynthesis monooxygenase [Rhodococcus sp. AW25M09]
MSVQTVTTVVSRRIHSGRHDAFIAWTSTGLAEANQFDGFLGGGWLRSDGHSDIAHVVYRFDTQRHLDTWLESNERRVWLQHNSEFVEAAETRHLTGVEGWFDGLSLPAETSAPPVPRWKQTTVVWLGFFPVSLLLNHILGPHLVEWSTLARTLLVTTLCTPFMTYVVLPFLTARLSFWLAR